MARGSLFGLPCCLETLLVGDLLGLCRSSWTKVTSVSRAGFWDIYVGQWTDGL